MKGNIKDKRVQRSINMLENAYIELLLEKPLNKILVKDVTDRAGVNRGTFYLHYNGVNDILESIERKIEEELIGIFDNLPKDDLYDRVYEALEFARKNKDIFTVLLGPDGDIKFTEKIMSIIGSKIMFFGSGSEERVNTKINIMADFCLYGCLGVIGGWLKKYSYTPTEKVAQMLTVMLNQFENQVRLAQK
ncbi:MAG TPA: hypothetical protein DCG28_02640 [Lachnospiraceae bacterium]|nr:hypothetical protein [Lachnospiraceae bacterium]